ncbi:hypothetical protein N0V91_002043 [Didymella pomorum]|uniref:Uncharacterized protein n=1 Tax=Didymella pomorum TaxID=749634 RepID=A0A9W9DA15_9PLEO|nr:hypothetical protein N0V91_002043 [Didymella pomorum]
MSLAAQYDGLKKLEQTVFDALLQELKEAEVKLIQSVSQLRETQAELKTAESEPIQATAKRDTSEKERTTTQEKLEHVQRELKCFTGMVTHTKAELAQTADGLLNVKTLEREARCTNAKLPPGSAGNLHFGAHVCFQRIGLAELESDDGSKVLDTVAFPPSSVTKL